MDKNTFEILEMREFAEDNTTTRASFGLSIDNHFTPMVNNTIAHYSWYSIDDTHGIVLLSGLE